jgi:hypothetical protein
MRPLRFILPLPQRLCVRSFLISLWRTAGKRYRAGGIVYYYPIVLDGETDLTLKAGIPLLLKGGISLLTSILHRITVTYGRASGHLG